MPYIITTTTWPFTPSGKGGGYRMQTESRTAVATLDEAQVAVDHLIEEHGGSIDEYDDLRTDTAAGLTVGSLPDGTVIEVRPISWNEIGNDLESVGIDPERIDDLLAAFNRSH